MTTGGALVGAAAIVTSLVLFAMQVNVERMPHGLFRQLSDDRKVLGAFAGTFFLAIGIAAASTVTERDNLAVVLIGAAWAFLAILGLFLYAYRRALRMINPGHQLEMLVRETSEELQGWGRKADRVGRALEEEDEDETAAAGEEPGPDATRTSFFQICPLWASTAKRNVEHAMAIARRYAEQDDYEAAGAALNAVVHINAGYVAAKGRTFYPNVLFVEHPLAHDDFISVTLELMRQNADRAIARRDERQIAQTMRALIGLVEVYLRIDYARRGAEKTHASLAAGYLSNAVHAVVPHDMTDVLMEGQRLLGRGAYGFVRAGSVLDSVGLGAKIAAVAHARCATEGYRAVTTVGMRQLADLTLELLRSRSHNAGYALGKVREQASEVAKRFLAVPDTAALGTHGTILAPYFSSGDTQGLRARLTEWVNIIVATGPDDAAAQGVLRNLEQWADEVHRTAKERLLQAIAVRSQFTIHMLQWIRGLTEILLVASDAPACDPHTREELRSHARWLIATLSFIPGDEETVTWVEIFQVTETVFDSAGDARRRGHHDHAREVGRTLLAWAFKGGRYITGWGVLESALCGCAALAVTDRAGAVDELKANIRRHLESDRAPDPEVRAHGARGIRRQKAELTGPDYAASTIERALGEAGYARVAPVLEEIADLLCPRAQ